MYSLRGRRLVLGITGGIAAYKAAELARLCVRDGAEVQVVMTEAATAFIGAMTLQAITGRPVRSALFDAAHEAAMGHIELARWAERVVVAPASADFIARMAAGLAPDLLGTLCLATASPPVVAPAMNQAMWRHPATVANVARLRERGVAVVGPAEGEQACGDTGPGRMVEPAAIHAHLAETLGRRGLFRGRRALVTAGPTHEAVDPVRFLGNRSSGKMGFAIAAALAAQQAEVVLVSGPVTLETPPGVTRVDVETALQMHAAVMNALSGVDLFVATAAVADYRPAHPADRKIKKESSGLTLELVRNPDILGDVAARSQRPFCVGFAAETDDVEVHAGEKRRRKGADMIAANRVGDGLGFGTDDNALTVLWDGGHASLPIQPKVVLAQRLVELIGERMGAQTAA